MTLEIDYLVRSNLSGSFLKLYCFWKEKRDCPYIHVDNGHYFEKELQILYEGNKFYENSLHHKENSILGGEEV